MNDEKDDIRALRILHIEDSPKDAEIIRERLIDAGFAMQIDWASNEQEFTTFLKSGSYDIILADYQLPAFDGEAALRLTKLICPDTPFICVSGAVGEEKAVELLKLGATDYVLKSRVAKLPLAMQRALREVEERTARRLAEATLLSYNEKLLSQNDQLLVTEEMLRVQIGEYVVSQELLKEAKTAAEAASYAKSQFLKIMSHELRTPMNGVLGMAQLLGMTDLTEEQRDYLAILTKTGKSLTLLLSDILELARIVDGTLRLEQTKFGLRASIDQVVAIHRSQADEKGLDFRMTVSPDVPDLLVGDPLRLRQILQNLLGNAVKFTSSGSVSLSASVTELHNTSMILELAVQDTGIGISSEKLDDIFNSFAQENNTDTRPYGGAGLGLTLSKRLVELMGGSIHVESSLGYGSKFRLVIPFTVID